MIEPADIVRTDCQFYAIDDELTANSLIVVSLQTTESPTNDAFVQETTTSTQRHIPLCQRDREPG